MEGGEEAYHAFEQTMWTRDVSDRPIADIHISGPVLEIGKWEVGSGWCVREKWNQ